MKWTKVNKGTFFITVICIAVIVYLAFFGFGPLKGANQMRYGIDIRGGVDAVFEPIGLDRAPTADEMDSARTVIESRLDAQNILDREVTVDKENGQVIVRFPWKSDETDFNPESAIAELGETAKLTFRDSQGNVLVEGKHVKKSSPAIDQQNGGNIVSLEFDSEGSKLFADATGRLVNQQIGIYMDEELISNPKVEQQISGGTAMITGMANAKEAKDLSDKINSGALPFSMTTKNHSSISPTLGSGALDMMVKAGLIAFILVCLFMIANYRLLGIVSSIALALQMAGQLLALSVPQFTLTLPGIAGIILSLGMGVDANVIISERIGEELKKGSSLRQAIQSGYHKAFSAVFDGNLTSAIVAVILMIFGSGTMLSFGYTLLTGIILNFVAGIFATRLMSSSLVQFRPFTNLKLFKIPRDKKRRKFYENRYFAYSISLVIIIVGLVASFAGGVKLDTQFKGGAMLKYTYTGEIDTAQASAAVEEQLNRPVSAQVTQDLATGENKIVLTLAGNTGITPQEQAALGDKLNELFPDAGMQLSESYMVEPYIGKTAMNRSIIAIILSAILITVYVWIRFSRISGLSAGVMALIALAHDVVIVFFTFVLMGIPLNDSFVAVVLTIIGYSINDTIVIYDRIRENKQLSPKTSVVELVNDSISQTLSRSINTSVTTVLCILVVFLFSKFTGITSMVTFSLPMLCGLICGCYSSVCIAGPLWVSWQRRKNRVHTA